MLSLRRRMLKLIKLRLVAAGVRAHAVRFGPARGLRLYADSAHKSQRIFGLEEREIAAIFQSAVARSNSLVDVGASDGYYTIWASVVHPSIVCVACDPVVGFREAFERNAALNHVNLSNIRWEPRLVGSQFSRLDGLLEGLPDPVCIKIDVDGAEMDVLESGRHQLDRRDATLIVETHAPELERDVLQFLTGLGFRCQVIKNAWWRMLIPELRPIPHNRWLLASRS